MNLHASNKAQIIQAFQRYVSKDASDAYADYVIQAFAQDRKKFDRPDLIMPITTDEIKTEGDYLTLTFKQGDRYAQVKLIWEKGLLQ